jgi:hypothetical protein
MHASAEALAFVGAFGRVATGNDINQVVTKLFLFVLIILYSLYLEYDSPLIPPASGLAG